MTGARYSRGQENQKSSLDFFWERVPLLLVPKKGVVHDKVDGLRFQVSREIGAKQCGAAIF
jgi:hypothetical protein